MRVVRADIAADPSLRERFLERAAAAARLDHPSIVPVVDSGFEDGILYSVGEYVESLTLTEHLNRLPAQRRLAGAAVRGIVRDIAAALDHAHGLGIVHGSLKPANVLVRARDGRALVTDFGLAVAPPGARLTMARDRIAAHACVAPEQAAGAADPTVAGDVYAFAAMLYGMAAGEPPLGRVLAAIAGHPDRPMPPLRLTAPHLPDGLDAVLARGLAAAPWDRFRGAGELAAAALAAMGGGVDGASDATVVTSDATVVTAPGPLWRPPVPDAPAMAPPPPRRRPVPVPGARAVATATVLALSAGAFIGVTWAVQQAPLPASPRTAPALPTPIPGLVGAPARVGALRLTVLDADPAGQPPAGLALRAGERFLVIGVLYDNVGPGTAIVSPYDWSLVDAAGTVYGAVDTGGLGQRELGPGQSARGLVGFVVPAGVEGLVATFSAESSNDSVRVPLDRGA